MYDHHILASTIYDFDYRILYMITIVKIMCICIQKVIKAIA